LDLTFNLFGPLTVTKIEQNGITMADENDSLNKLKIISIAQTIVTNSQRKIIDGSKVIDMTKIQPKSNTNLYGKQQQQMPPARSQYQYEDCSTNSDSKMANAAMIYSQQMNYYAQFGMSPYRGMYAHVGLPNF
jgi:hypothetical protein